MLIGQPVDSKVDVGAAVRKGDEVKVQLFSGSSVLSPGSPTDKVEVIDRVLSPLAVEEVGTIRCIGLNVSVWSGGLGGSLALTYVSATKSTRATPRRPRWR